MSDGKQSASDRDANVKEGMKELRRVNNWQLLKDKDKSDKDTAFSSHNFHVQSLPIPIFIPSPTRFVPAGKVSSHDYVSHLPYRRQPLLKSEEIRLVISSRRFILPPRKCISSQKRPLPSFRPCLEVDYIRYEAQRWLCHHSCFK